MRLMDPSAVEGLGSGIGGAEEEPRSGGAEPQGAPRRSRGVSGQEHSGAVVGKGELGGAPTTSSARRTYTAKVVVTCSSLVIDKRSAGRGARARPATPSGDNFWIFLETSPPG